MVCTYMDLNLYELLYMDIFTQLASPVYCVESLGVFKTVSCRNKEINIRISYHEKPFCPTDMSIIILILGGKYILHRIENLNEMTRLWILNEVTKNKCSWICLKYIGPAFHSQNTWGWSINDCAGYHDLGLDLKKKKTHKKTSLVTVNQIRIYKRSIQAD